MKRIALAGAIATLLTPAMIHAQTRKTPAPVVDDDGHFILPTCSMRDSAGRNHTGSVFNATCVGILDFERMSAERLAVQVGVTNVGSAPIAAGINMFLLDDGDGNMGVRTIVNQSPEVYSALHSEQVIGGVVNPGETIPIWIVFDIAPFQRIDWPRKWLLRWGAAGYIGLMAHKEEERLIPVDLIYAPPPKYPGEARALAIHGRVVVQIYVNERGIPESPKIIYPQGHGMDEAALDAVSKYRFTPQTIYGKPAGQKVNIEVNFTP
jgi:TonB family protein